MFVFWVFLIEKLATFGHRRSRLPRDSIERKPKMSIRACQHIDSHSRTFHTELASTSQ